MLSKVRCLGGNPMVVIDVLEDRWRHFGTASWTIPTYTKNSTDGISNLSRTIS